MRDETIPISHFEDLYAKSEDPWGFASSDYEAAKYAETLAALPRQRYGSAFEVGCSVGVLTHALADRCDRLLAIEPVEIALDAARRRNAEKPWVIFANGLIPRDWPEARFDLVVLSEVLDYLGGADLTAVARHLETTLAPSGDAVLVHWIGKKAGKPAAPDEASEILIAELGAAWSPVLQRRGPSYRLDVLRRIA